MVARKNKSFFYRQPAKNLNSPLKDYKIYTRFMKKFISLLIGLCIFSWISAQEESINLSGLWRFQTDPMGFGKTPGSELYTSRLTGNIMLPGSMDENGKGIPNNALYIDRLSRKFEYCGQAWYQREIEIPESWENKEIILFLERCHWETSVYVDGIPAGTDERLSTPNRFVLTSQLTPGIHTLTLCIDNRLKLIQLEENAPSEAKIISNEKNDNEVIDLEQYAKLKEEASGSDVVPLGASIETTTNSATTNKPISMNEANVEVYSKVLIGKYETFEDARSAQDAVREVNRGTTPFIRKVGDIYALQVGSFQDLEVAKQVASRFRAENFDVWIYQQ